MQFNQCLHHLILFLLSKNKEYIIIMSNLSNYTESDEYDQHDQYLQERRRRNRDEVTSPSFKQKVIRSYEEKKIESDYRIPKNSYAILCSFSSNKCEVYSKMVIPPTMELVSDEFENYYCWQCSLS